MSSYQRDNVQLVISAIHQIVFKVFKLTANCWPMIKTTTFFLISTCSNILCLRQCSHLFSYVSWLWIDDKSEHTDFVLIPGSQWIRISLCIWQSHAIISLKVHSPIYFPVPICKNDGNISSWVPPYDLFRQLPFYRTFPYGSSSIFGVLLVLYISILKKVVFTTFWHTEIDDIAFICLAITDLTKGLSQNTF